MHPNDISHKKFSGFRPPQEPAKEKCTADRKTETLQCNYIGTFEQKTTCIPLFVTHSLFLSQRVVQSCTSVQIQHAKSSWLSARSLLLVVLAAIMFDDGQSRLWIEELSDNLAWKVYAVHGL